MPWLVTHSGDALNTEHVQRLYAEKTKVKAQIAGFSVNVAVATCLPTSPSGCCGSSWTR